MSYGAGTVQAVGATVSTGEHAVSDVIGWFRGPPGDPGRIRSLAGEVDALGHEFAQSRNAVNEAVAELCSSWQGSAAQAFRERWQGGRGDGGAPAQLLDAMASSFGDLSGALRDYADKLEDAQHRHFMQLAVTGVLLVASGVELGMNPAADAGAVAAVTEMSVGEIAVGIGGTMLEGGALAFSGDLVSQLDADLLDHLDPEFDSSGHHAVPLVDWREAVESGIGGGVSFGAIRGLGGAGTFSSLLRNPLTQRFTVSATAGAVDAGEQLLTNHSVDFGQVALTGMVAGATYTSPRVGGATEGTSSLPLGTADTWGNPATLGRHFADHGADFGASSADEYASQASKFLQRSQGEGLPTRIDANGVIRTYDPATNEFGAFNANGTTRTYFSPNPAIHGYPTNWDYWLSQAGAEPWAP